MGATTSTETNMASPIASTIARRIAQSKVVIYSKTYCPYCHMAKKVFDDLDQEYDVIELDQVSDGGEIQSELAKMTGIRTVPQVFVKGKCIGGGTDTQKLSREGKLQAMLE